VRQNKYRVKWIKIKKKMRIIYSCGIRSVERKFPSVCGSVETFTLELFCDKRESDRGVDDDDDGAIE
jgi:hypothetical protein